MLRDIVYETNKANVNRKFDMLLFKRLLFSREPLYIHIDFPPNSLTVQTAKKSQGESFSCIRESFVTDAMLVSRRLKTQKFETVFSKRKTLPPLRNKRFLRFFPPVRGIFHFLAAQKSSQFSRVQKAKNAANLRKALRKRLLCRLDATGLETYEKIYF